MGILAFSCHMHRQVLNLAPVFYCGDKETALGNIVACGAVESGGRGNNGGMEAITVSLTRVTADPLPITKRRGSLRMIVLRRLAARLTSRV